MKAYLSLVGALGLGVGLLAGSSVAAQDQANLTAAVHAGSCAEPGESVLALDAFRPGRGQAVGVSGVPIVLESSTDDIAGLSGRQLIDSPHILAVFDGETIVACGAVGGLTDDDDLTIGLSPVDDSGVFGIANIEDIEEADDDDLEIDLYVVQPVG